MSLEELSETEWKEGINRLNETRENLDVLFSLIEQENEPENEMEVRKVIGDQTSILIKEFLESHIRQRTFWQMREKSDEC